MTGLTVGALSLTEFTGCPSLLLNRAYSRGRPSSVCETRRPALVGVNTTGPAHAWLHPSLPASTSALGARNVDSVKYTTRSSVRVQAAVAPAEASEVSDDTSVSANERAGMQSTNQFGLPGLRGQGFTNTVRTLPAERSE